METLATAFEYEEEIKKSRFIVKAFPVQSVERCFSILEEIKDPSANHNCWAYRIGDQYRFSDDGEPGGTAGKPILNAIEKQNLDQVFVVVIRFFGGIKLGAGGLIRAYGGSAARCLQKANRIEMIRLVTLSIRFGYPNLGGVQSVLNRYRIQPEEDFYTNDTITFDLSIPAEIQDPLSNELQNICSGQLEILSD